MEIKQIAIDDLKPSEYNPRQATEKECADLKNSIKRFGLVDPIIVNSADNRKNVIIGGHFRCRMAKEMGIETVPVVFVDIPDIEKEKELNIRLNKNSGEWDFDLLANFDEELLKEVGFESKELDKIFQIDNFEIEIKELLRWLLPAKMRMMLKLNTINYAKKVTNAVF